MATGPNAQEPARYAALQQGNKGGLLTGVGLEVASAPDGKGLLVRAAHLYHLGMPGWRCLLLGHWLPAAGQRPQALAPRPDTACLLQQRLT